jgi:Flp pilus assembly protein TadD
MRHRIVVLSFVAVVGTMALYDLWFLRRHEPALRLEPYFAPPAANLADLDRPQGRDDVGERVLREALQRTPDVSALHYALGLRPARQHDLPARIAELRRAAALSPGNRDIRSALALALANGRTR